MTEAQIKEIFLNNLVAVKAVGRIDFFMLEGKQYVGKYDCDTLQHIYDELLLHEGRKLKRKRKACWHPSWPL